MIDEAMRRRALEKVRGMTFMDDIFMSKAFDNEPECMEYVLRTVMQRDDIYVKSVRSQNTYTNLYGRSARLDVLAVDKSDRLYDIEVQRDARHGAPRRARYYSSIMDSSAVRTGDDFAMLPETVVIFFTETDYFRQGRPVYWFTRRTEENLPLGDGTSIIYVNCSYRGDDAIGDLIHDMTCREPEDVKNLALRGRMEYLKVDEVGKATMCEAIADMIAESNEKSRQEGILEGRLEGRQEGILEERANRVKMLSEKLSKPLAEVCQMLCYTDSETAEIMKVLS